MAWVNRPEPNPADTDVPLYRAAPCPACADPEPVTDRQDRLWRLSGIETPERDGRTFETFDLAANPGMKPAHDAAWRWGAGDAPPFLVLWSRTKGLGKTHLALAAADYCVRRCESVSYHVVPTLLAELQATQRPAFDGEEPPQSPERVLRHPLTYSAVILDDLGANKSTEWRDEQLYRIINQRWSKRLRTLITMNVDPARIEERLRSRIQDWQTSLVITCEGRDFRSRP